jgi:Gpi18-like mannosyltransferase
VEISLIERGLGWLEKLPKVKWVALITGILVIATIARFESYPRVSDDYTYYIGHWIRIIQNEGIQAWNSARYANYSPTIIYLLWFGSHVASILPVDDQGLATLKIAAALVDLLLGFAMFTLAKALGASPRRAWIAVALWSLTPSLLLNAAWWGQFDAGYAAFLLLSTAALFRRRLDLSISLFAFAFFWKAQALFTLPAFAAFWLADFLALSSSEKKRITLRGFLGILGAYLITILPAATQGMSWDAVFRIYLGQPEAFRKLSMNAPNIWALFPDLTYEEWVLPGLIGGAVVAAAIFVRAFLWARRSSATERATWILLSALAIPFILPKMHDRYFFVAEALTIPIAILDRDRQGITFWFGLQVLALATYGTYLFAWPKPSWPILVMTLGAIVFVVAHGLLAPKRPTPSS